MKIWLLVIVLSVPSLAWAAAETLYVRPVESCPTNGNGTAYACASTPGGVGAFSTTYPMAYSLTDETAGSIDPGDTLYVCGSFIVATNGNFFFGPADASGLGSGTVNNRVTISFACPGDPGSINAVTGGSYALATYAHDLNIVLAPTTVLQGGTLGVLVVSDSAGAETAVVNVTISGSGTITRTTAAITECVRILGRNIILDGPTIYNCHRNGVFGKGKNMTIKNTIVSLVNTEGNTNVGDCNQHTGEGDGYYEYNNYCDHTDVDSKYCSVYNGVTDNARTRYEKNVCLKRSSDTLGAGHAGSRTESNATYIKNTYTGGVTGIQCLQTIGQTCDIIGNVFINTAGAAVVIASGTVNVCNNTIIGAVIGVQVTGTVATQVVCNNIFHSVTTGIDKVSSATPIDRNNLFYNVSGNNLVVSGTPTTPGTGSLLATNPLLVGTTYTTAAGYLNGRARTQGNSPARRAGIAIGPCIDARGRACYPDRPDIGAYQATSGDPANTR